MANCCSLTVANTGFGCTPLMEVVEKFIEVSYLDGDGAINAIDITDAFNLAYFVALANQADDDLKWYPLPFVKNMVDERTDADFETFDDNTKIERQIGIRSVSCMITPEGRNGGAVSPTMLGKINDKKCKVSGFYGITKSKQLVGEEITDGYLSPIRVDNGSINAKLVKTGSGATVQKISLSFDWHIDVQDSRLRTIEVADLGTDLSLLKGLLDVSHVVSGIIATQFVSKMNTEYGDMLNPVVVEGLLAGDMALYNVTTSGAVAITSAVESPAGSYTVVYAAQTAADVLRLTVTKNGYNFAAVTAATVIAV